MMKAVGSIRTDFYYGSSFPGDYRQNTRRLDIIIPIISVKAVSETYGKYCT
jgi:hypothetical protein